MLTNIDPESKKELRGPFDIIGDVHGCYDELVELLGKLGYAIDIEAQRCTNSGDRIAVFLGDLVDRGPKVPQVLRLVMSMDAAGQAICVPGNHDMKFFRKLRGNQVKISHGLQETLDQMAEEPPEFAQAVREYLEQMPSHHVLDGGNLVVAHAGIKEKDHGRQSERIYAFTLYGETNGETDAYGLPVRVDWAKNYSGAAKVVYGHTPNYNPRWVNNTMNLDTGCVFGGSLTALRYPELELVSVKALSCYCETQRPFMPESEISPRPAT